MSLVVLFSGLLALVTELFLVSRLQPGRALGGQEILSLLLAGAIVLLTPVNLRRLVAEGAAAGEGARPYFFLVLILFGTAAVASIFGSARETEIRFVAHLLGAEAVNRILLLFPVRLFSFLRRWRRSRVFRLVGLALVNLVLLIAVSEGILRTLPWLDSRFDFLLLQDGYAARKLRRPVFGEPPNSRGFNDREVPVEKPPGTFRIAVVGDSFVVGFVPRRFGFVHRLEERLKPARTSIEVVNFGVVGSEPADYLEILNREVLSFEPDLVLIGLYVGNDIKLRRSQVSPLYKEWYLTFRALDRVFARERTGRRFVDLTRIQDRREENWMVWGRIPEVWNREEFLRQSARREALLRIEASSELERAWSTTFSLLAEIRQLCVRAPVPAAVVIFPDSVQVDPELRRELARTRNWDLSALDLAAPQRRLARFLERNGTPYLDLLAHLDGAGDVPARELFLPNDGHFSPLGNQWSAAVTAIWLEQTGLLARP